MPRVSRIVRTDVSNTLLARYNQLRRHTKGELRSNNHGQSMRAVEERVYET